MKSDGEGLLKRLLDQALELLRVALEVLGLEVLVLLELGVWAQLEAVLYEALRAPVELDQCQVRARAMVLVLVHLRARPWSCHREPRPGSIRRVAGSAP